MDKPNIGILDDASLAEVRNLAERNLAVELPERLLEGEIKSRFAGNVVQNKKFSDMLTEFSRIGPYHAHPVPAQWRRARPAGLGSPQATRRSS